MRLRDVFLRYKEEDADGLSPVKDNDAEARENSRKTIMVLNGLGYMLDWVFGEGHLCSDLTLW